MTNPKRLAIIGGLAIGGLAVARGLQAFPRSADWRDDPSQGAHAGAGDIWSTGSVRDRGIACLHCHVDDARQQGMIAVEISYDPPLSAGNYAPGTAYTVTVALLGEHLGLSDQASDTNGFAATYEDVNGNELGALQADLSDGCPAETPVHGDAFAPGTTYTYGDCHAIASLGKPGLTSWTYRWTAPAAGSGTVYAYHGVVDGDADRRSLGDDVKMDRAELAEGP